MKLEQIYESYYVDPLVAINSSSAAELLEAFEQAATETPNIGEILASLHEGQIPVNESELTNEQKVFFIGATKVVNAYKESNDPEFKLRFESLINDARAGKGAIPPVIPSTAPASAAPKKGFLDKLTSFFGNIGRGINAFTRGLVQGFTGSEGKDKTGKDRPGWTSVTSKQDLSNIPDKGIGIAPERLKELDVDEEIIDKLQRGEISGINVTDVNNNLISVSIISGRLQIKKIPTYKGTIDATKNTRKTVTTKPGKKELSDDPRNVRRRAQAAAKKKEAPAAPAPAPAPAAPSRITKSEVNELRALLSKGFALSAEDKIRMKELLSKPGANIAKKGDEPERGKIVQFPGTVKKPKAAAGKKVRAETQFQNTVRSVLREFYETSK